MYAIIAHGGVADFIPTEKEDEKLLKIMNKAKEKGKKILEKGGSCVDAVEKVIKYLEDSNEFNCGKGSVKNNEGKVEMDATIMQSKDMSWGSVGAVRDIHTISMARKVMDKTKGLFIVGRGAEKFINNKTKKKKKHFKKTETIYFDLGTVGCVCLDKSGNMAAGISSGGAFNKYPGRLGDAAVLGGGILANKNIAVSSSGIGEEFIKHSIANTIHCAMKYGKMTLKNACKDALDLLPEESAGIIALDSEGNMVIAHNCKKFYAVSENN